MRSSRRHDQGSVKNKLAELRSLRLAGKSRLEQYEVDQEDKLYDEVDEAGFQKLARSRLETDDFVVDDNGEGYADHGLDDWEHEPDDEELSKDDELIGNSKRLNRAKLSKSKKAKSDHKDISAYIHRKGSANTVKKVMTTEEDNDFMAGILGELNEDELMSSPSDVKIRSIHQDKEQIHSALRESTQNVAHARVVIKSELSSSPPPILLDTAINYPGLTESELINPKSDLVTDDGENDVDELLAVQRRHVATSLTNDSVSIEAKRPIDTVNEVDKLLPPLSSDSAFDMQGLHDIRQNLNVVSSPVSAQTYSRLDKMTVKEAVEPDGSIRFFWTDYAETSGFLLIFGKVYNKTSKSWESAFAKVDGVLRSLYFLPRETRQRNGEQTNEEVTMMNVYEEVSQLLSKHKVDLFKSKPSSRNYAFELPDVPQKSDYLNVLYPYSKPPLPFDLQGETFSRVFGINTSLFEQFVLYRRIMGPCWLTITNPDFNNAKNASWCKLEFYVADPAQICPSSDAERTGLKDIPPLTLASLAFRTIVNQKITQQEIVVASLRIFTNVDLEDSISADRLPCQVLTIACPIQGRTFPIGIEQELKNHKGQIKLEKSEAALLNCLMARLQMADPDVLLGHGLENVDYAILLHRLKHHNILNWHRIGRMKRYEWPKSFGPHSNSFGLRQIAAGRLICDLANDMGRSIIKGQSWTLTEMCALQLGHKRHEFDNYKIKSDWTTTTKGFMDLVLHCDLDTYFIAAIAIKVQILQLSKQLTNLAGNSWARTLTGTRAERNEYILLHEFHTHKYICPDKVYTRLQKISLTEDGEEADDISSKKKDKYKGGLVLEPRRGLYDKIVLVMDFNSLYPSIIQEYNICFTTVERTLKPNEDEMEGVPDVPEAGQPQGILPRLIATLVNRRKQVKKLMNDKHATETQLAQWDIKQQALKLTANSMYGCLGYSKSRFYARPLAILTTFKGREVLSNAKELAETLNLQVIYGDTDSLMISTSLDSIPEAIKIGNDFKQAVNERYRFLEIDIDNVYQRMLLHAKKKYAALQLIQINGTYESKMDVKGLDMRRREYCALSKDASTYVLEQILSGKPTEEVVEHVHEYLRNLAAQVRGDQIPLNKFIIFTKLGKNPEDYPNGKIEPQVQVALKKRAKGQTVRINDVIAYVITKDDGGNKHIADRAFPPADLLQPNSQLKIDHEFYLAKQILPPIDRICAPIDGTDAARISDCLGLDPRKYSTNIVINDAHREIQPLESLIPDEERFRDAEKLKLQCRKCFGEQFFEGFVLSKDSLTAKGIRCNQCLITFTFTSLGAQIECQLRQFVKRYYESWVICDDAACLNRTRQISVYGRRCLVPGCRGQMRYEYSDKAVYAQLLYFESLLDTEKAVEKASGEEKLLVTALSEQNRALIINLRNLIVQYLQKCGRRYVNMEAIFKYV